MAAVSEQTGSIVGSESRRFSEVSKGFTIFAENDVLFAKITPCMENGKAAIARNLENCIGVGSTEFFVLRPTDRILSGFIFHFVRQTSFRALCKANFTGSAGQQRVPKSFLEKVAIPLPPLDEQRRIVRILDRASDIKRRADAARSKASALSPALFLDMFGDPATNPKGWPTMRLGELIDSITGGKNIEAGAGVSIYRILKVSAVTSGRFNANESKAAPDDYVPPGDHFVKQGDFLFSRANTSALVGAVAIVEEFVPSVLLPDKLWRIKWNQIFIEPRFAYSLLQSKAVRATFSKVASGTSDSMKNISQAKLYEIRVPVPPLPLQTAFAERARRIEALAYALDAAAAKAEAMAAALSAKVFDAAPAGGNGHAPA